MADEGPASDEHTASFAGRPYTVRADAPAFYDEAERREALERVERGLYEIFQKYMQ